MKRFIARFFAYAVLFYVVLVTLNYCVDRGMLNSDFGNLKEWREILNGRAEADVLIQGSSRAWVQYDTYLIDSLLETNSYNLGMDGAPFDIQYLRWKTWIDRHPKPRMIIQNVDLDLLDASEQVFQKYQYLPFIADDSFRKLLAEQDILTTADRIFPFTVYMGQPQAIRIGLESSLNLNRYPSTKYKGFEAHDAGFDGSKLALLKQQPKREWVVDDRQLALFRQFIAGCKARGIELVLVYAPVYHELDEVVADFNASRTLFAELAQQYDLAFLDYSMTDMSNDQRYFYNTTHLNKRGATEFSRRLAENLKKVSSTFKERGTEKQKR